MMEHDGGSQSDCNVGAAKLLPLNEMLDGDATLKNKPFASNMLLKPKCSSFIDESSTLPLTDSGISSFSPDSSSSNPIICPTIPNHGALQTLDAGSWLIEEKVPDSPIIINDQAIDACAPQSQLHTETQAPRFKLTVLSISGICISNDLHMSSTNSISSSSFYSDHCHQPHLRSGQSCFSSDSNNSIDTSNVAISASVSFAGSCDPKEMLVSSSVYCDTSGRLVVKSRPVVIPEEMEDGLMAFWDDDEKHSDGLMVGKGRILAEPNVKPHLFFALPEKSERMGSQEQLKIMVESKGIENCPSLIQVDSDSSIDKSNQQIPKDERQHNLNFTDLAGLGEAEFGFSTNSFPSKTHCKEQRSSNVLINTSFPEIIEINVSLDVHQIDHGRDESLDVQSACTPCIEGGGAVAHLVLFPEDLNFDEPSQPHICGNNQKLEEGKTMSIPIRKRIIHHIPVRNSNSFPHVGSTNSKSLCGSKRVFRQGKKDSVWVDIEEHSMMRVRVEKVTKDDETKRIKNEVEIQAFLSSQATKRIDKTSSCANIAINGKKNHEDNEPGDSIDNFDNLLMKKKTDYGEVKEEDSRDKVETLKDDDYRQLTEHMHLQLKKVGHDENLVRVDKEGNECNITKSVSQEMRYKIKKKEEHKTEIAKSGYCVDEKKLLWDPSTPKETAQCKKEPKFVTPKMILTGKRVFCNNALIMDEVLEKLSSMVVHCSDDIDGCNVDTLSMDSTIGTEGTI